MDDRGGTTEGTGASGQGGVVPLFATPFAAVNTGAQGEFNARLARLCEQHRGPADFFDSADATVGELQRLILRNAATVVAGLSGLANEEFARLRVQARGWCSIVQRNGHVPAQHFPGASWLTMYCVQAGAGVLRLYERRLGSIYRDESTWELKSPYRYGNHTWTPLPGWMALFPAHVPHEVSVVRSATSLILVFALIRFMDPDAKDSRYG